jgi:hypothetical protein
VGLALAAGLVLPAPAPAGPDPLRLERAATDLAALAAAFQAHLVDTGRWPVEVDASRPTRRDLPTPGNLAANGLGLPGWAGPYLDATETGPAGGVLDPWGRPFVLVCLPRAPVGTPRGLWLCSAGPDRTLRSEPRDLAAGRLRGDDIAVEVSAQP